MARSSRTGLLLIVAVSGLLSTTVYFASSRVLAASPAFSLTTSPVSANLHIKPGTNGTSTLQVMNNNITPVQVSLQLEVFSANGSDGSAAINALPADSAQTSWVHFSQTTFVAKPGVWTPIKVTINLPADAELGYYYAILFKPTLPSSNAPHTTTIKGANAILVLVDTSSANEDRQLTVSNFSATKKLYEYLPANFSVTVKNGGNIFLAPSGDIFISKSSNFSHPLDVLNINPGSGNVLPNSVRIFKTSWNNGFPVFKTKTLDGQPLEDKSGQPVESLSWNFAQLNKLRFGKYYAHLALVYNNGSEEIPINSVTSFWVIPWKILIGLFVLVIIILIGFWSVGRSFFRRARRLPKLRTSKIKLRKK
jgi:hypothetical protein